MKVSLTALAALFGLLDSHSSNNPPLGINSRRIELYRGRVRKKSWTTVSHRHDGSRPFLREMIEEIIADCNSSPVVSHLPPGRRLKVPVTWNARGVLLTDTNLGVSLTNTLPSQPIFFLRPVDEIESWTGPIPPGQKLDLRFNDHVLIKDSIVLVYPRQ